MLIFLETRPREP